MRIQTQFAVHLYIFEHRAIAVGHQGQHLGNLPLFGIHPRVHSDRVTYLGPAVDTYRQVIYAQRGLPQHEVHAVQVNGTRQVDFDLHILHILLLFDLGIHRQGLEFQSYIVPVLYLCIEPETVDRGFDAVFTIHEGEAIARHHRIVHMYLVKRQLEG